MNRPSLPDKPGESQQLDLFEWAAQQRPRDTNEHQPNDNGKEGQRHG